MQRGRIFWLNTDHFYTRSYLFNKSRHTGDQTAATDWHEDSFNIFRMLAQDLHTNRALSLG